MLGLALQTPALFKAQLYTLTDSKQHELLSEESDIKKYISEGRFKSLKKYPKNYKIARLELFCSSLVSPCFVSELYLRNLRIFKQSALFFYFA